MANVPIGSAGGWVPSAMGLFCTDSLRTWAVSSRSPSVGAMSANSPSGMSIVCTGSVTCWPTSSPLVSLAPVK